VEVEEVYARFRAIRQGLRVAKKAEAIWFGEHASRFRGAGYDLRGVDAWRPGEPLRDIAWALSLRSYPDRLFRIERMEPKEIPVVVMADLSSSMRFAISADSNKALLLLDCIGVIALTRANMHDPVGVLGFSEQVDLFIKPKRGISHVYFMAKQVFAQLQAGADEHSKRRADWSSGLTLAASSLRSRHSIYVLSDFVDATNDMSSLDWALLRRLGRRHDVTALMLTDPREFSFRRRLGYVRTSNMETGEHVQISARKAPLVRQAIAAAQANLQRRLWRDCGIRSAVVAAEKGVEPLVTTLVARALRLGTTDGSRLD
jgi:uncharacterized protein (DUF58 family)